jgi:hypothetical protein
LPYGPASHTAIPHAELCSGGSMGILNPHSAGTLKEDHSCFLLSVSPTHCSLVAAECLLLSSPPPLPSPHQSLPGGAASSTPPADFQTLGIPLRVASPQLPLCIWRAESRLTPPFSETWPDPPRGRSHKPQSSQPSVLQTTFLLLLYPSQFSSCRRGG